MFFLRIKTRHKEDIFEKKQLRNRLRFLSLEVIRLILKNILRIKLLMMIKHDSDEKSN